MAPSDSESELFDDVEEDLDEEPEAEPEIEEETLEAVEDATEEGDDESGSEDSEDGSDEEGSEHTVEISGDTLAEAFAAEMATQLSGTPSQASQSQSAPNKAPSPPPLARKRSLSPAGLRRKALKLKIGPRTFQVEAICALPHPVPTHSLAASKCMTHLLTGSDDGYIRDYDIFTALNGKNFLTAPQRHHSGVVEGIMKAGQLRFWWENPAPSSVPVEEDRSISPAYSLEMHSDALWALAGSDTGHINLFTVRHWPGRVCHTFSAHRGPVSSLSLDHDEKSFFSAGWDGEAMQWDLNTGQRTRTFTSHGAQLMCIAVRPTNAVYSENGSPVVIQPEPESTPLHNAQSYPVNGSNGPSQTETDAKSDASFDPLFDDEPEDAPKSAVVNGDSAPQPLKPSASTVAPPRGAPPLLDHDRYKTFSPDILMTVAIDGQIMLWDKRVNTPGEGVGRLWMSEKTPPWCLSASWSADGNQIYAGRRNGTVEIYDVRQTGRANLGQGPRLLKTLRNPVSSGVVSCIVGFPDSKHIACASIDNIRLWNVAEAVESDLTGRTKSGVQFKIIPGHHGGYISQMLVDPGARFLVSASSNRATWQGDSTRTVFVHDIKHIQ
ncbi:WD40 repeat-like protein [Dendrothele bispora CBS 962.96]|uniref:WD40 repeat-like protein n=1 Tax=Dendrothele bispora (strain CBS 962.96) TaxID=1314807 RepID=A0A4S8LLH6_DENBC|nr:WD40 repeat-like protein [Dendrothele bispora CBS 962.96]